MRRKLTLVNVLLAAAILAGGWKLRQDYVAAQREQEAFIQQQPAPAALPVFTPEEKPQPVQAAAYLPVAEQMLFSQDRNSDVVIEETPEQEKPVPPFPTAHGLVGWGGDVTVILAVNGKQKGFRAGDTVGDFKLASVGANELVFEWDGQQFKKTFDELKQKAEQPAEAASASASAASSSGPTTTVLTDPTEVAEAARRRVQEQTSARSVNAQDVLRRQRSGSAGLPGLPSNGANRLCDPADGSPTGTVRGGFQKVVVNSPFGQSCRWEPVRQ